jgi:hypothetical protein
MRRLMNRTDYKISYPDKQLEKNEMGGECSTDRESKGVYRVLVSKMKDTTWKTQA